jgi:hypothetical protein
MIFRYINIAQNSIQLTTAQSGKNSRANFEIRTLTRQLIQRNCQTLASIFHKNKKEKKDLTPMILDEEQKQ